MSARRRTRLSAAFLLLSMGCGSPRVPAHALPSMAVLPRVTPHKMRSAPIEPSTRTELPRAPEVSCQPGQLAWRPEQCRFAECENGHIAAASNDDDELRDCLRPLGLELRFSPNDARLAVKQLAELENLAAMASVLGVPQLTVSGRQSWDETPDARAKAPLSVLRANAVRDVLAGHVTPRPLAIAVEDGGTRPRRDVTGEAGARIVTVAMPPFAPSAMPPASAPFSLPWTVCESNVTLRTPITLSTRDGDVLVEVCRNGKCSRGIVRSSYYAVWPGEGSSVMNGDFQAVLAMKPTAQQLVHNGEIELGKGEGPASFWLSVSIQDPDIRETDVFRWRLLRRRKEPALDWSGKLSFERTKPHPTRPVPACLSGSLEITQDRHSLR